MLDNAVPVCFLATENASGSREFFGRKLGLTFVSEDEFALVFRLHGSMLRIQKVEHVEPRPYTVLGWSVADLRQEVSDFAQRGVRFERYQGLDQDDLGIWTSPAGAQVAWFRDPDGNVLSLTES